MFILLASHLPVLLGKSLKCWTLSTNYSTKIFHTSHAFWQHWPLPFHTTFRGLGLESQGQQKAKHLVFIFLHTSQLIRMKFNVMLEQFKLNSLILPQNIFFLNWRNNCCCAVFRIGIYLDVYRLILFRLGQMILYISVLFEQPWHWFKVARVWKRMRFFYSK